MTHAPATKPSAISRSEFLSAVRSSGISPPVPVLAELLEDLSPDAPAPAVAHRLVVKGVLTRFQADRLLAGRSDGFILGPYVILEPLGVESGGQKFRARHRVMDRLVCVWVSAADNPRRADYLEAARRVAVLAHPHVLTVLDVNPAGRGTVVSEYVDGATLDAIVRLAGRLPIGRACDLLRQVALGLAHAHERGLCHGRLTAGAVLVGRPGGGGPEGRMAVKLTDFAAGPADAAGVAGDLAALGQLGRHLFAGKPDTPPPRLPQVLTRLLGHLAGRQPPSAAEVAERLTPFADPDYGLVDLDLPTDPFVSLPPGVLSGEQPGPAPEACPFADLVAEQPTDTGGVTRAEAVHARGGVPWAAVGVAAGVSLLVVVQVAGMLWWLGGAAPTPR